MVNICAYVVTNNTRGARNFLPHPLCPPLLTRLSAGEGEGRERGALPLLNTPLGVGKRTTEQAIDNARVVG